jgi:hypothetical protein
MYSGVDKAAALLTLEIKLHFRPMLVLVQPERLRPSCRNHKEPSQNQKDIQQVAT